MNDCYPQLLTHLHDRKFDQRLVALSYEVWFPLELCKGSRATVSHEGGPAQNCKFLWFQPNLSGVPLAFQAESMVCFEKRLDWAEAVKYFPQAKLFSNAPSLAKNQGSRAT